MKQVKLWCHQIICGKLNSSHQVKNQWQTNFWSPERVISLTADVIKQNHFKIVTAFESISISTLSVSDIDKVLPNLLKFGWDTSTEASGADSTDMNSENMLAYDTLHHLTWNLVNFVRQKEKTKVPLLHYVSKLSKLTPGKVDTRQGFAQSVSLLIKLSARQQISSSSKVFTGVEEVQILARGLWNDVDGATSRGSGQGKDKMRFLWKNCILYGRLLHYCMWFLQFPAVKTPIDDFSHNLRAGKLRCKLQHQNMEDFWGDMVNSFTISLHTSDIGN